MRETVTGNRVVWLVVGLMVLLQLAFTYAPPLPAVFRTVPLGEVAALAGTILQGGVRGRIVVDVNA